MKTSAPPTRRKFADPQEQIDYLYDKLLYWLYERQDPRRARPYARRLARLVARTDPNQESAGGQEYRSLICEARGDLAGAIRHRQSEIRKIRRLHKMSENTPDWDYVSRFYDHTDLSDRLDLLALLYDEAGDTRKAIRVLEESKEYCRQYGIPFDGQEILDELSEDFAPAKNGRPPRKNRSA